METLHPSEIDLGLERVRAVCRRLALDRPGFAIITVAGTNGKGSTVAMLEAMLHAAGYRVGSYTSPHLIDYNERVRIQTSPVSDEELCAAFGRIDAQRAGTSLTYFEFGTLAAMELFRVHGVEIAVLEVGLGGRLDAVNVWDADVAIISSIGIDHTDWLGPDRESIGREKAGIFRNGRPAVCSDPSPPATIEQVAAETGARLYRTGRDFGFETNDSSWTWRCGAQVRSALPHPAMRGPWQLNNAAGVLMALELLAARFPVSQAQVRSGLLGAVLPGRFQTLPGRPLRIFDVAHNVEAVESLAANLRSQPVAGRTIAVCGMLRDKPVAGALQVMAPLVDAWHMAALTTGRGASAQVLSQAAADAGIRVPVMQHADPVGAWLAACAGAGPDDRIVVFGSFHTVGAILRQLSQGQDGQRGG
jgi:dihydrofolate synthase/folylpolyglutamate synthase